MGQAKTKRKAVTACPIVKHPTIAERLGCINTSHGGTGTAIWKCHGQA